MKKILENVKSGSVGLVLAMLLSTLCLLPTVSLAQVAAPPAIGFPAGMVGTAESTIASTFTNSTNATLSTVTVAITGTNSGDFGVTTNPSTNCGGSLTAAATCTLTVSFTPGGFGARSAILTVAWTGGSLVVPLYGSGLASGMLLTAYTNATTSFTSVPGIAFPINASQNLTGTCAITWQGSASTTGPKYQFTGPGSPTAVAVGLFTPVTSSTLTNVSAVAFSSPVANANTVTATTNFTDRLTIGVVNGTTAGTVQLQAAAVGAGTLTIQPGSFCIWQPM